MNSLTVFFIGKTRGFLPAQTLLGCKTLILGNHFPRTVDFDDQTVDFVGLGDDPKHLVATGAAFIAGLADAIGFRLNRVRKQQAEWDFAGGLDSVALHDKAVSERPQVLVLIFPELGIREYLS